MLGLKMLQFSPVSGKFLGHEKYVGDFFLKNIMSAALLCFTGTNPLMRARCQVRENPQVGAKSSIVHQRAQ